MEFLNEVNLRGIVGSVRRVDIGNRSFYRFSLSTQQVYKNSDVVYVDCTWHDCEVWEKDTDVAPEKGMKMSVHGRLKEQRFTDAAGYERRVKIVVADKVEEVE